MEERYFAVQMAAARKQGRIKPIPIMTAKRVNTFWDLGRDTTFIWFHQYAALEHRFIDCLHGVGKTLDYYATEIQNKGYLLGTIYLPHDGGDKSVVTNITAKAKLQELFPGVKIRIVPRVPMKQIAIDAARVRLAECYIHEINCREGIDGLENYRKKWSEAIGNWSDEPVHDTASHPADAFMQFAQGWEPSHELGTAPIKHVPQYRPHDEGIGL